MQVQLDYSMAEILKLKAALVEFGKTSKLT